MEKYVPQKPAKKAVQPSKTGTVAGRIKARWVKIKQAIQNAKIKKMGKNAKKLTDDALAKQAAAKSEIEKNAATQRAILKAKQLLEQRTKEALKQPFFVEACKKAGVNPKKLFGFFYPKLSTNENIRLERNLEKAAKIGRGETFVPVVFYCEKIVRWLEKNPASVEGLKAKGKI